MTQKRTLTRGMSPYNFVGESTRAYAMITDIPLLDFLFLRYDLKMADGKLLS